MTDRRTFDELPRREQIARLAATGWTPRDIAARLRISTKAVYKYMREMRKEAEETPK